MENKAYFPPELSGIDLVALNYRASDIAPIEIADPQAEIVFLKNRVQILEYQVKMLCAAAGIDPEGWTP